MKCPPCAALIKPDIIFRILLVELTELVQMLSHQIVANVVMTFTNNAKHHRSQ